MSRRRTIRIVSAILAAGAAAFSSGASRADDVPLVVGQTMPYSGPASGWGTVGKVQAAFFRMINEKGGVSGRPIRFLSLDDAYTPSKTVEQTRKLVESDNAVLMFGSLGTTNNAAVQKYLNGKKVPQLFIFSGAARWNDPERFPWTMPWIAGFRMEGRVFAKYVLRTHPAATIAILSQNDDFGRDYLAGFEDGLGKDGARMIVARATYEATEPSIDAQVTRLAGSKADVLINISSPKFTAQSVRKAGELGWRPAHFISSNSTSIASVLTPAGLNHATGLLSASYLKDPSDPQWTNDPGMTAYRDFMAKYYPEGAPTDTFNIYGVAAAQTLMTVLEQCGKDLSAENIMKQAANLSNTQLPLFLPGITLNTSATRFAPISQLVMMRFDGSTWKRFGEPLAE